MTAPQHVVDNPRLGRWVSVADGQVRVHVGKVELGQGILTALHQLAADALGLPLERVRVVPAHTGLGPDQGLTSGSLSVTQSAPALGWVGGAVRALTGRPADDDAYVAAIAALDPALDLTGVEPAPALPVASVGTDAPRLDLPDKVHGRPRYLTDLRPDGMLHGRVLRPPSPGATLESVPEEWKSAGVTLVRDGSFLGVVGEREVDVDVALASLRDAAAWHEADTLPDEDRLSEWLRAGPHEDIPLVDESVGATTTHRASYSKPFLVHASIAPSCGMAQWTADGLHVWSHSQGVHALRKALAGALELDPATVVVEHVENAGCYGHNGADDAAFDAVLLARAVPGRPVLLRWSRSDELTWGPLSPAMTATVAARLVDGRIDGWDYDVWSTGHTSRPGYAGTPGLLALQHLATPVALPAPVDPPHATGGGTTRNALPGYDVGPRRVVGHRLTRTPLRSSAMRALGAFLNVFAIESFLDELAEAAGADPVEFRLAHLSDPRARAVVELAAERAGWGAPLPEDVGRGLGFARYKERGAYCAVVAEVALTHEVEVRRLTVAADLGTVVNPDGARNQLEGGAVQATSWTVAERVRFDRRRIVSADWESYPILRFPSAPVVKVHLIDPKDPAQPPLGSGEAAQGPTAAAIGNAIAAALGVRVRDLPLDAASIARAIEQTP